MRPAAPVGKRQSGQHPASGMDAMEQATRLMRQALSLMEGAGGLPPPSFGGSCLGEEDRLIRLPEVLRLTGMCRSALYNQMALGQFPRSIKIGPRAASWSAKEVRVWIAQRKG